MFVVETVGGPFVTRLAPGYYFVYSSFNTRLKKDKNVPEISDKQKFVNFFIQ